MIWQDKPRKRPDTKVLFVVSFRDGSRSFVRVPPKLDLNSVGLIWASSAV